MLLRKFTNWHAYMTTAGDFVRHREVVCINIGLLLIWELGVWCFFSETQLIGENFITAQSEDELKTFEKILINTFKYSQPIDFLFLYF